MKKIIFSISVFLTCTVSLSAQITREQADAILRDYVKNEITQPYSIYAKKGVQTNMTINTDAGEMLELAYACWVYYFDKDSVCSYLIVNESNGNLVEVNPKGYATPCDLAEWRKVEKETYPIEIPFTECSLLKPSCRWQMYLFDPDITTIINSNEELNQYGSCTEDGYPEIDFLKYSLICTRGTAPSSPADVINIQLLQTSDDEYSWYLDIKGNMHGSPGTWFVSIIVPKLPQNAVVTSIRTILMP